MAMATVQLAAMSTSNSDTTSYNGTAGTPASGDLLIAFVSVSNSVAAGAMTGTFGWTLFARQVYSNHTIYAFWAYASAATSTTPSFNCSDDAATGALIHVARLTGLDGQTQPYVRQVKTASGTSANPSVALDAAVLTGSGCLLFVGTASNGAPSSPSGWSQLGTNNTTVPIHNAATHYRNSGETGSTITPGTITSAAWGIIFIEFYVSGAGKSPVDDYGQNGMFGI